MGMIGKLTSNALLWVTFFVLPLSFAGMKAGVDRNDISLDESLSLKITADTQNSSHFEPKFEAPDFEIMNQFESSSFSSVYNNGQFESKSEKTVTFILRPLKIGTLKIKNIQNKDGPEKAPDLVVQVSRDNGNGRKSLGGEAPSLKGDAKNFFVKAEASKSKIYKGEQLIVSYYLYRRTRANLRDVMQYPTFQGFIREDLEMPILSGRPDFEAVSLGGVPFERGLLARYALYPVRDGKLKIDSLGIRADYIPKNEATDDMFEDPFFQFFSQVTPRTGTSKSDPLTIEVAPLPEDGKSPLFTGGVGSFEVSTQLDPSNLKKNSPFTFKIILQGKGNASLVEFPNVNWPQEFKFYESKGKSRNLGQGNTEKEFEVVLVPKEKGPLQIPSIAFEFFDPDTRSYVQKKTNPIQIQVGEADPQNANANPDSVQRHLEDDINASASPAQGYGSIKIKDSTSPDGASTLLGQPVWRIVAWLGLLVLFSFFGLVVWDQVRKRSQLQLDLLKRKEDLNVFWNTLLRDAEKLQKESAPLSRYSSLMEQMIDQIHQAIDERFHLASRALPRRELGKLLTENTTAEGKLSQEQWKRVSAILEFAEMIRFVSNAGIAQEDEARHRAILIIEDAIKISAELSPKILSPKITKNE